MHYYKKNIGDYAKKTGRLSMLEHGAYTLLLDSCYDRERFPTLDEAIDWTWARTEAETDAVKFVLSKFFTLIDGVYVQNRVKEELAEYKAKAETNARIAKEREEKRKNGKQSLPQENDSPRIVNESCEKTHEPSPNHKPITNNQEPITNIHTTPIGVVSSPEKIVDENVQSEKTVTVAVLVKTHGVDSQVAKDFLANRKTKKLPLTKTAFDGMCREFDLAGLTVADGIRIATENGWAGFKKVWLDNLQSSRGNGGSVSKIPDNNTTDWLTPELAAKCGVLS